MSELIGRELGPYQIIERIGAGGMATVYRAYHAAMDRYLAVKVLPEQMCAEPELRKRFEREAKVVAGLEHTHILPVHDYGEAGNRLYLAMRYIRAGTLKDKISAEPMDLVEVNRLFRQVGSALDYAHRLGIVHRDVKPSNVLLDNEGNCYLTDFGLAKILESSVQLTASGVGLGTPAYMSPEQGQGDKADARSDIYALGVVLYEMIAGQTPYQAETPMAVVLMHINAPLPPLRTVKPDAPEEVERVILKAMAKDPDDRFQTVREMMDALDEAVKTARQEPPVESVLVEPPPSLPDPVPAGTSTPKRTGPKWVWATVGVAAVSLICMVTLLVATQFLPFKVRVEDGQVELVRRAETTPTVLWSPTPQKVGETAVQTTTTPSDPASTATTQPTYSPTAVLQAMPTSTASEPMQTAPTPIPWTNEFVQVAVLDEGGYQAAFSPDGKLLAVTGHDVTLYDTQTWQQVRTLGRDGAAGIAFSPDGRTLAAIMGEVKLFDIATGAERLVLPGFEIHTSAASGHSMAFSPDGSTLFVVVDDVVKLFDVDSGDEKGIILAPGAFSIDLSPNGQTMAVAGWGSGLSLWGVASGQQIRTLGDVMLGAQRAIFTPDGTKLVSSSTGFETEAILWDVENGRTLGSFAGHGDTINDLAFSPDGRLLATVSSDVTIKVWDVEAKQALQTITGHSKQANSIAFSPDGTMLVSTSWDGTTRIWSTASKEAVAMPSPTQAPAGPTMTPVPLSDLAISAENASQVKQASSLAQGGEEVAFSPDGRFLAVAGHELVVYDAETGQQVRKIGRGNSGGITFSPDGRTLAAIMGEVKLFDVTTGAELHTLLGTRTSTSAASGCFLAFTPDGGTLAVVVSEVVKLFDVESGIETGLIIARGSNAIAISPDGRLLASGAWDSLSLWDTATGQQVRILGDRFASAHRLAFSPDGSILVSTGTGEEPIQLWNVESGRQLRNWQGHTDTINSLAFSPDGRLLVTASSDLTIKVWDVTTGQELQTLVGHTGQVSGVAFSADGATLASTTWNGPTLLWNAVR